MFFGEYLNHIKHVVNKDLSQFYISVAIRNFALSLIGIFIPLYLANELSYPLQKVIVFFVVANISMGFSTLLAAFLASKIGVNRVILISILTLIPYLFLIRSLEVAPGLFYPLAIISGLSSALFWYSYHFEMTKNTIVKYGGEEIGLLKATSTFAATIAPFIGGLALTYLSFNFLFIASSILLLASVYPLFKAHDIKPRTAFKLSYLKPEKQKTRLYLAFIAIGTRSSGLDIFYPLFIFTILGSYLNIGILASLMTFVTVVLYLLIGNFVDKRDYLKTLKLGALLHSIAWAIKGFMDSATKIFTIGTYSAVSFMFVDLSHGKEVYDFASKTDASSFLAVREIIVAFSKLLPLAVFYLTESFVITFTFIAFSMLLYAIPKQKPL